jgi:uncharacterized protein (DUF983 family)
MRELGEGTQGADQTVRRPRDGGVLFVVILAAIAFFLIFAALVLVDAADSAWPLLVLVVPLLLLAVCVRLALPLLRRPAAGA